jgi:hypothetical protein
MHLLGKMHLLFAALVAGEFASVFLVMLCGWFRDICSCAALL